MEMKKMLKNVKFLCSDSMSKMLKCKAGVGRALDTVLNKLLVVIVVPIAAAALVPTILSAFANLSTSGLILSSLFGTVLGIILAVFIFRAVADTLR